jgi:hypothetical protein
VLDQTAATGPASTRTDTIRRPDTTDEVLSRDPGQKGLDRQ